MSGAKDRAWVVYDVGSTEIEHMRWEHPPRTAVLWRTPYGWRLANDPTPGYAMLLQPLVLSDDEGGEPVLT